MSLGFSIIMQSYLDLYNGSRKDPEKKFIRAVNSFLSQTHKNNELIIVSDDCDITEKLYLENFKDIKNIIYERVENKERKRMYSLEDGKKVFRGYPRSVGQEIATKDVIGYMDSDDIILPSHLSNIEYGWSLYDYQLFHSVNSYEMLPLEAVFPDGLSDIVFSQLVSKNLVVNMVKYFGYNKFYVAESIDPEIIDGNIVHRTATQVNFHLKKAKTRWSDSLERSEDGIFSIALSDERRRVAGRFAVTNSPTYVFCHRNFERVKWDF
jgi:glycosyltransferase involved in cell wall biosynthesis